MHDNALWILIELWNEKENNFEIILFRCCLWISHLSLKQLSFQGKEKCRLETGYGGISREIIYSAEARAFP